MNNILNKILGVFLIAFLFGFLSKLLQWDVWPQLATYAGLGVALVLFLKSAFVASPNKYIRASSLALGLYFLFSALSAFLSFEGLLLGVSGVFFLLFIILYLIGVRQNKLPIHRTKHTLLLTVFGIYMLGALFKIMHLLYADIVVMLSFVMAGVWIVAFFIAKRS